MIIGRVTFRGKRALAAHGPRRLDFAAIFGFEGRKKLKRAIEATDKFIIELNNVLSVHNLLRRYGIADR